MPAISGGNQHGVDVFAGEQFAKVAQDDAVLGLVLLVDQLLGRIATAGLHVGNRHAARTSGKVSICFRS